MSKTVLILGAGSTRATAANRAIAKRPPLDSDFFEVARLGRYPSYDVVSEVLVDLVGEYSATIKTSLERAATYLYLKAIDSSPGSPYHIGFLNLLNLLNTVLSNTTNPISTGRRSLMYRFLLSELRRLEKPEDMTVITFNYDLMVEKTLDEIASCNGENIFQFPNCYRLNNIASTTRIRGFDGFKNSKNQHLGVSVLKLHGSMNWLSRHTSNEPRPRTLFSPRRELHVADSPLISTNMTWKRKQRTVYLKPIIVPPVSGKRGMMHVEFSPLWSKAAKSLREADRIIVAGYSCPPLDIEARMLLSENLRQNNSKKLYVIDPCAEAAAKFIDICGVSHSTIYSSIKAWVDNV